METVQYGRLPALMYEELPYLDTGHYRNPDESTAETLLKIHSSTHLKMPILGINVTTEHIKPGFFNLLFEYYPAFKFPII
ncbi:hypothetical protein NPIL_275291 [Nephila pilipes]|uniref:Uncharacterized protein n=1 Tax=Nephila pilipes TaxID=299642 RepID=A0A8X6QZ46_NEPPI|nr:hypothetical protein NPIL_275291 [Nephila pilipes]